MTAARQGKNAHLTQSQVGEDEPVAVVAAVDHFYKRGGLSRADCLIVAVDHFYKRGILSRADCLIVAVDHFYKRGGLSRADLLCYYINVTKRCNTTGINKKN